MSEPVTTDRPAVYDSGGSVTPTLPGSQKPAARWEDFIDIFYAPSEVYARRANSGFGIPMVVVTIVSAAIFLAAANALSPMFDAEVSRKIAIEVRKGATPEAIEKMRGFMQTSMKLVPVIFLPVVIWLTGFVLWLSGKLVGARQTLTAAVMVAAFANVPRLLGTLLGAVQALVLDPSALNSRYAIGFSLARMMDPDTSSPVLFGLAGRLDIVTIWITVLLAIGLAVTGRIPRGKAAIAAGITFVVGSLPELFGALSS